MLNITFTKIRTFFEYKIDFNSRYLIIFFFDTREKFKLKVAEHIICLRRWIEILFLHIYRIVHYLSTLCTETAT